MRTILLVLVMVTFASPALATDGVLEINQTCAVQTGCFSGDPPGLPVVITGVAGNSYRLTSNLSVGLGNHDTDGIFVNTSRVTLDFNGFTLSGSSIGTITGSGTGVAINGGTTVGTAASYLTLRNGTIRGWRGAGVQIAEADGVRIEEMVFEFNQGNSIEVGDDALIVGNRIVAGGATGQNGITAGKGSHILGNLVREMADTGITCSTSCSIRDNSSIGNTVDGIKSQTAAIVSGNQAYANGDDGIDLFGSATVFGNHAQSNDDDGIISEFVGSNIFDNMVIANAGDGIEVVGGGSVQRNVVRGNEGYGLNLGANTTYRANTITVFTPPPLGTVSGGIDMGANSCGGAATCP